MQKSATHICECGLLHWRRMRSTHRSRATHICECGLLHWRRMRSICKFDAVSLRRHRNPTGVEQRIYANADFCIGRECEAFANSTQCHCGGTAIPKEKMRRYSNAPPVAELPADRKKFCKRRKSGVESNRGPRAKSLILAGANSMQRTAATVIFFCVLTLSHKCGVWRCYSNAPPVAELPLGSFLATQCSAPRDGVISLRFGEAHASRPRPET